MFGIGVQIQAMIKESSGQQDQQIKHTFPSKTLGGVPMTICFELRDDQVIK